MSAPNSKTNSNANTNNGPSGNELAACAAVAKSIGDSVQAALLKDLPGAIGFLKEAWAQEAGGKKVEAKGESLVFLVHRPFSCFNSSHANAFLLRRLAHGGRRG